MNKIKAFVALIVAAILLVSCATIAPTQFYRPANYAGEPYRISGKLESMQGLVIIFINDKEVIKKSLPFFGNTTEASGVFEDKKISTTVTRVKTFMSSYVRADVFVGSEKAATLTF